MPSIVQVTTRDGRVYNIEIQLLKKYSNFFDVMIDYEEESKQLIMITLQHIGYQAFDYIFQFLQLHKFKAPMKVCKPVIKGIPLNVIMSEEDAELMSRISALKTDSKVDIINAVSYLRIETFKTLLTYALMQKELQQPLPELTADVTLQQKIKTQIQMRINSLIEMENHIKRLQTENFQLSNQHS